MRLRAPDCAHPVRGYGPEPLYGLCVLGVGEAAGPALGDAPTQLYLCVNLLSAHNCTPGTFRNLFTSPVAPDPFRICQGEIGGAGVALSHLGHPGDIPGSDESGSDNREKNKS